MHIGFLLDGRQIWNRWQLQGVAKVVKTREDVRLTLIPGDGLLERALPPSLEGIIGSFNSGTLQTLRKHQIASLNFSRHTGPPVGGELWTDYDNLADIVLQHLVERGIRRIACFGNRNVAYPTLRDMRLALWKKVGEMKLDVLGDFEPPGSPHPWTLEGQLQELGDWLRLLPKPAALVCTDSEHAGRALEAARLAGVKIPGEIMLISFDHDSAYLECCSPTISHVDLNQIQKGSRACELLLEMLEKKRKQPFRELVKPAGVVALQSTAYAAPEDPQLQRALALLESWEYEMPSVEDLALAAGMSRSTLLRRMMSRLGKKPGELLYQSRREKAMRLLREEELSMAELADRCGYGLPSQLTHDIKQHTSLSPKQYREAWRGRY